MRILLVLLALCSIWNSTSGIKPDTVNAHKIDSILECSVNNDIPGITAVVCTEGDISIAVLTNVSVIENLRVMDIITGIVEDIYSKLARGQDRGNSIEEIHMAVREGNLEKVKEVLTVRPELLNAREKIGHTPLNLSAVYAKWDIFRYLLDAGADVNIITLSNTTVMHAVCQHDRPDMAALLIKKEGDPCLKVKDIYGGYTPMLRAVQSGCRNMVEFLLRNGAIPGEVTSEGWNALHLAAKCGHRHLYTILKENGVDVDATDDAGNKPMDYDFERPEQVIPDNIDINEYTGNFTWEGAPQGFYLTFFLENGILFLDDYSINELYPIGQDLFYCTKNPWQIKFTRDDKNVISRVELIFLRRIVTLIKINYTNGRAYHPAVHHGVVDPDPGCLWIEIYMPAGSRQ